MRPWLVIVTGSLMILSTVAGAVLLGYALLHSRLALAAVGPVYCAVLVLFYALAFAPVMFKLERIFWRSR